MVGSFREKRKIEPRTHLKILFLSRKVGGNQSNSCQILAEPRASNDASGHMIQRWRSTVQVGYGSSVYHPHPTILGLYVVRKAWQPPARCHTHGEEERREGERVFSSLVQHFSVSPLCALASPTFQPTLLSGKKTPPP